MAFLRKSPHKFSAAESEWVLRLHAAERGRNHTPVQSLSWFKAKLKEGIAAGLLDPDATADGLKSLVRRHIVILEAARAGTSWGERAQAAGQPLGKQPDGADVD